LKAAARNMGQPPVLRRHTYTDPAGTLFTAVHT
jgi:hypothetical protein